MKLTRYAKYSWSVLFYTMAVILWGAFVRATGSGAGCGAHWPLCNGQVIPRAPQVETIIEFIHRLTSGLSGVLVIGLVIGALHTYSRGHPVRRGAWLSMFFIITEGLVGASLVLFGWVAKDASVSRAVAIALHLINTFLLLAALSLTAWWASGGRDLDLSSRGSVFWGLLLGLLGVLVLGVSGALNALGDTLFPVSSLAEGVSQDFSPTAHFLIRLRLFHPSLAVMVGAYLILFTGLMNLQSFGPLSQRLTRLLTVLILLQGGAGLVNVALLAPVWMQLVHLFLADSVWITLVFLSASLFTRGAAIETEEMPAPQAISKSHPI